MSAARAVPAAHLGREPADDIRSHSDRSTSTGFAVSARALAIGALGGRSIASILENNLDRQPAAPATETPPLVHANIRGSRYFH